MRSAQNCKKCTFLDNLRTITQETNMKTRQMTPFSSFTFSTLFIFVTFIFVFENGQWHHLWSIPVCKIPQFWAKATNSGMRLSHAISLQHKLYVYIISCGLNNIINCSLDNLTNSFTIHEMDEYCVILK